MAETSSKRRSRSDAEPRGREAGSERAATTRAGFAARVRRPPRRTAPRRDADGARGDRSRRGPDPQLPRRRDDEVDRRRGHRRAPRRIPTAGSGSISRCRATDEIRIVADALGLHPLIAEDIAERNQRAKVETFDDGRRPRRPVRPRLRGRGERGRDRLRPRRALPADGPRRDARRSRRRRRSGSASRRRWRRARTSCCTPSPTRSSTATSRCSTRSATTSTSSRTG